MLQTHLGSTVTDRMFSDRIKPVETRLSTQTQIY